MKRFILLWIITAASTTLNAQGLKIELKHNGFAAVPDSTKNYAVLECPKVSKVDLFKKTLTYVNSLYQNPSRVVTSVEGESITVNAVMTDIKTKLYWFKYEFTYNIVIQFKDGKVRFEPKFVDLIEDPNPSPKRKIYLANTDSPKPNEIDCVFMTSNKNPGYFVNQEGIKQSIDTWANGYLAGIDKALNDKW